MKNKIILLTTLITYIVGTKSNAQLSKSLEILSKSVTVEDADTPKKSYWTTGMEGSIFSTSYFVRPGKTAGLSTLRFSSFFHMGTRYHNNFSKRVGFMTGIGIKNIGFIDKYNAPDSTVKRRIYALSIPVALKLGNMYEDNYFLLGAAMDLALNYKEKGYVKRNDKTKFNEWFSERTPLFLPNLYAGYVFSSGIYITYHYYPINFLNQNFADENGMKPYAGYKVNLMYLTVGWNIRKYPKYDR